MLRTCWKYFLKLDELVEEGLPGLLLACMAVGITVSVFARYLLHSPISGIPEIATNAMLWIVFLGSAAVTRRGLHIALDVFTNPLAPRAKAVCSIVAGLCTAAILSLLIVWSWSYLSSTTRVLPMTRIPLTYAWVALPIGAMLMLIHEVVLLVRSISGLIHGDFSYQTSTFTDQFEADEEVLEQPK